MKSLLAGIISISMVLIYSGCVATLKEYKAQSPDEEAIVNQLKVWQEAFNRRDLDTFLELYREDAKIMAGGRRERKILSKQEYAKYIAGRMYDLHVDYIGIPKIETNGDVADVKVTIGISGNPVYHNLTFNRSGGAGKWLIKNSEHHF